MLNTNILFAKLIILSSVRLNVRLSVHLHPGVRLRLSVRLHLCVRLHLIVRLSVRLCMSDMSVAYVYI